MKTSWKQFIFLILLLSGPACSSADDTNYEDIFGPVNSTGMAPESDPTATTTNSKVASKEVSSEENEACGKDQICVPYYMCHADGFVNTDGTDLFDEQRDEPLNVCPMLQVCCNRKSIATGSKLDNTSQTGALPIPMMCGSRNIQGLGDSNLESDKKFAKFGEFPWMVAVLMEKEPGLIFNGGGSLIHPKIVLTAAHIVAESEPQELIIRAGEWDAQSEDEIYNHEDQKVQSVIIHESFTRKNLQNDLALLVLVNELTMTPSTNTVCLPPKSANFVNQRCVVSGWGKDTFKETGQYSRYLKKIELPIVAAETCQESLRNTRFGENFELHNGFLCAGGEEGQGTCTGDGGSPLVCSASPDFEHYYQTGVVVGGVGCGMKDLPSLFVDISKYRDWIDEKILELGLDASSYTV